MSGRKKRQRDSNTTEYLLKAAGRPSEAPSNRNAEISEDAVSIWGPGVDGLDVIAPPYDPLYLLRLTEDSDELPQCIDAVVRGVAGGGIMATVDLPDDVAKSLDQETMAEEKAEIHNFLEHCGQTDTFSDIYLKCMRDYVQFGRAYIEVIRDDNGRIAQLEHVCASQVRHTSLERKPVERRYKQRIKNADGTYALKDALEFRRFRRFVQASTEGMSLNRVHFKEFGDPRKFSAYDGRLLSQDDDTSTADLAHELIHFGAYNPSGSSYGNPAYIGALYAVSGARFAEKANITTFKNNNVPSMAISVSGGVLTNESITRIKNFVDTHIEGSSNLSKFLLLEAESSYENEEAGAVKVAITPLTNVQRSDGMFQGYHDDCRGSIRRSWRLPGLIVGDSKEWTGAAIDGARRFSDETIFAPMRSQWDRFINRLLAPELDWLYHSLVTITPNTTDNQVLALILNNMEKTGGLTPAISRRILEKILGESLGSFPEDFKSDVPFSLTMAEAVKNMADPAEPGQQVTAIK
jgi:PBSX family phage portal protein